MLESFRALLSTTSGMQAEHVTTAQVTLPNAKYAGRARTSVFVNSLLERLGTTPGIESRAIVNVLPLARQHTIGLALSDIEGGGGQANPEDRPFALYLQVSPGYFTTMGIPLLRGRDLTTTDDSTTAAVVINKTMADALWPKQIPSVVASAWATGASSSASLATFAPTASTKSPRCRCTCRKHSTRARTSTSSFVEHSRQKRWVRGFAMRCAQSINRRRCITSDR